MNTNDLEEMEQYHLNMAKIAESHVRHHQQQAASFRNRRKELKKKIDMRAANISTEAIIKALTEK